MKMSALLFGLFVLLVSCASTSITTIRNPAISNIAYARILISVPFQDLELRRHAENKFVSDFQEAGLSAVSALDVVPPLKQYTDSEVNDILKQNSIDAVMVVTLTNAYSDQTYVPQASQTSSSATIHGNTISGTSQTRTTGGYYRSKPRANFEVSLFDVKTGQVAWKATTATRGNSFAKSNTLIDSLADEVVKKYEADSMR